MSIPNGLLDESADDLFETAPCGYLTTALDGSILRVNRTFEELTGRKRENPSARAFRTADPGRSDLPRKALRAVVKDAGMRCGRSRSRSSAPTQQRPAFVNAVVRHDKQVNRGERTTVLSTQTDRRRYERNC